MSDNETSAPTSSPAVRAVKKNWASILLVVLVVIFIAQNTQQTRLHFLWLTFESAMWFVLLLTTIVGFLIGALAARRRAKRSSPA